MTKRCFMIVAVAVLSSVLLAPAQTQTNNPRVVDWAGGYFGLFNRLRVSSKGLSEVRSVSVNYLPNQEDDEKLLLPDKVGLIPTVGVLVSNDNVRYSFAKSNLIEGGRLVKLKFVTHPVNGVNYAFTDKYLDRATELHRGGKIARYITLIGTLTKFRRGRKIAQAQIGLEQFGLE